jgi:hypothetical protein
MELEQIPYGGVQLIHHFGNAEVVCRFLEGNESNHLASLYRSLWRCTRRACPWRVGHSRNRRAADVNAKPRRLGEGVGGRSIEFASESDLRRIGRDVQVSITGGNYAAP